jgi:hypothetical protein
LEPDERLGRQRVVELLQRGEPDGDLGVDDGVDRELATVGRVDQSLLRPPGPLRILGGDVEQYIAVDEGDHHP